ncbi:hypothetical protein MYX75_06675 [Acidobacteria bacterium AH-259-A15]|nr:hypothetical protein [Acidobacteria bacterium AH-259-A15]
MVHAPAVIVKRFGAGVNLSAPVDRWSSSPKVVLTADGEQFLMIRREQSGHTLGADGVISA